MLCIQYLEDSPALLHMDSEMVVEKLRLAAEILPFTHLLIGWNVPPPLLKACRTEAEHLGMRFLRWHPLLCGDGVFQPRPAWQIVGLTGRKVIGYHGLPEFTFVCPNHPEVQETLCLRLEELIHQGNYQGFFLDRVRFPSPSTDPANDLGCFCEHCQRKAAEADLELVKIQAEILRQIQAEAGRISMITTLLSGWSNPEYPELNQFLAFRKRSIRDFIALVVQHLRNARLEIGLDCFSTSLTNMVGQDLNTLSELADWIKLMTYAHTNAPAGIPYEISGLVRYLSNTSRLSEEQAMRRISECVRLPLPNRCLSLQKDGLSTPVLEEEVKRGLEVSSIPILAGMELVEMEGITNLNPDQIKSDLRGLIGSGSAGLALSWDLLHIPLEKLVLVRQIYLGNPSP